MLLLLGVVGAVGGTLAGLVVLGSAAPPPPTGHLPLWGGLYSTLLWPLAWGVTEQAVYVGYAAPRLRARVGAPLALLIVAFFWAGQHVFLPFRGDVAFAALRFLSSLPIAVAAVLLFWRLGRLWPLALAHMALDVAAGALTLR
jgi:membrane protease YdiL (CAAX protease family)